MLTPSDWFQRTVVALLLLTFVLLIHHPTYVRAAGTIEGHGRFEKIAGKPSMGYKELYEWDLYLCPGNNSWSGVSRRLGAPPGQAPRGDGFYRIENVPAGTYSILVNQPNFFASPKVETNVQIVDNQTTTQHVLLDVDYSTYFRDTANEEWTDWGPWDWYQTFEATGTSIRGVSWVMAGAGGIYHGKTALVKILEDNGNPNVTTWPSIATKTLGSLGADTDLWLRWYSGEVPITPGKKYAVNIHIDGGLAIYKRDKDGQSYASGRAYYQDGTPQDMDLCITVFVDRNNQIVTHTQLDSHIGDPTADSTRWGQTFRATGTGLAAVNVYAWSGLADFTLTWTVHQGGPGGTQVGPTKTIWGAYYGAATDLIGVSYNPTEVPLTPDQTYYIEFTNPTAFNPQKHKLGNAYSDGTAYKNGTAQSFDLNLTIMQYSSTGPGDGYTDSVGLAGYWQLDETQGIVAADSSGNGHKGTWKGQEEEEEDPNWSGGKVGGSLCLDGIDDYVDLEVRDRLKPALPLTMAAWIKLAEAGNVQAIINLDEKNLDTYHRIYGSQLTVWDTGKLLVSYGDGQRGFSSRYKWGRTVLQPNLWYHVAAVIRGADDIRLYLNGHQDDDGGDPDGTGGAMAYANGASQIGSRNGDQLFLNGCIDDAVLFDVALTPEQIYRLYKLSGKSFLPPCGDILLPGQALLPGDINRNCKVDLNDYFWLGLEWLESGKPLLADIYEDLNDRVDHSDLALMLSDWLEEIDPSLIGHWKLDESGGASAHDSSAYLHHGQLQGNPSWTGGHINNAISLDGDGDYINCGYDPIFDLTGAITVAAWIKTSTLAEKKTIIAKHDDAWRMRVRNGNIEFVLGGINGQEFYTLTGSAVNNDIWHHVACVYDETTVKIYLNGQPDASEPATGSIVTNTQEVMIGRNAKWIEGDDDRDFEGKIDDVRVYNRALKSSEIAALASN